MAQRGDKLFSKIKKAVILFFIILVTASVSFGGCGVIEQTDCGDGFCVTGESSSTCPGDCPMPSQ